MEDEIWGTDPRVAKQASEFGSWALCAIALAIFVGVAGLIETKTSLPMMWPTLAAYVTLAIAWRICTTKGRRADA